MRGTVEGLGSRHPIGLRLPGLYHDDDFTQHFTAGLDEVLAPVFTTLDSIEAYVDPLLAPFDFVEWLSEWVGVELEGSWPVERQRALVARAAHLYAWQGTRRGLAELVEIYTGVIPEIEESGGMIWSPEPGNEFPGSADFTVTVRVRVPDPTAVDLRNLERLVARAKPAHLSHQIEVLPGVITCGRCGHENDRLDEFCGSCGSFLDLTGQTAVEPDSADRPEPALDPSPPEPRDTAAAALAEAEANRQKAAQRRVVAEEEETRTAELARVAAAEAEEARRAERDAIRAVESAAAARAAAPTPPVHSATAVPDKELARGDSLSPAERDRRAAALLAKRARSTAEPDTSPVERVPSTAERVTTAPPPAEQAVGACPTCGRVNDPDRRFCAKCGTRLDSAP